MKKKILSLVCCIALLICLLPKQFAFADPFTASQIGATAYALMSSWGIGFTAGNATAAGMGSFMSGQIEQYVNSRGGSIESVFGSQLAVNVAGQLVIGQQMYNALINFKDWLVSKYDLSNVDLTLTDGSYEGLSIPTDIISGKETITGVGIEALCEGGSYIWGEKNPYTYNIVKIYNGGSFIHAFSQIGNYRPTGSYFVRYQNNIVVAYAQYTDRNYNNYYYSANIATVPGGLTDSLSWNGSNYVEPTVIDPSYEWIGTVGDYQDTNLDQLLGHILEDVEGNNLIVDGDVVPIEPPQPTPTYEPVDPDTILPEVPLGAIDEIIGNLGGTIEDALEEQTGSIESAVEGAIEGQTGALEDAIEGQTGVISGAIDQAISDIDSAISEQTGSITDALEGVESAVGSIELTIDDALEVPEMRKFDLRTLFPFCIPFDIARILGSFDGVATAPHVQIPIVIQSINFSYNLDLDFSAFDPVAAILRQVELIAFAVFLAYSTSKVIRW